MYLEPSRTFYNGAFSRNIFCVCKIHKKTSLLESHINKVTGLYLATSLKESASTQVVNFARYLRHPFLEHQMTTSLLRKKKIINKIVKNPLRKGKKWKQLARKTTTQAKQKLNHYLHQVFISFYYSKMSLFLFSLLPI